MSRVPILVFFSFLLFINDIKCIRILFILDVLKISLTVEFQDDLCAINNLEYIKILKSNTSPRIYVLEFIFNNCF